MNSVTLTLTQYNHRSKLHVSYTHTSDGSFTEIDGTLYRLVNAQYCMDTHSWVHTLELAEFSYQVEHTVDTVFNTVQCSVIDTMSNPRVSASIAGITLLLGIIIGLVL